MAPTKSVRSSTKPYERPSTSSKAKGKGKAVDLGAPSTTSQSSRKGKKAWRKNIDITNEEEALEKGREEERVTGGTVASKSNNELFTVDVVGDVEVGKKARRAHKPLRSLAVLAERSAVPSLTSKTSSSSSSSTKKPKSVVSSAEKERLRRIARKTTLNPDELNSSADIRKLDPTSTTRDVWEESVKQEEEERLKKTVLGGFGEETILTKKVKVPSTLKKQRDIYLNEHVTNGIHSDIPTGGISYNPSLESHQELMNKAVEEELQVLRKEAQVDKKVEELGGVVENRKLNWKPSEFAEGMSVGPGEHNLSDNENEDEEVILKKQSKRKTTAQRNKALRNKIAQQNIKAEIEKRKLLNSVSSVTSNSFRKEVERKAREQYEKESQAKLAKERKEKLGLKGGEKVGKYRVGKKRVEVQLGEDLAESLRQVKPEGNLFKDRFMALQKRALIEPRQPVLPKRRTKKIIEYEKHAYKRFE
ncbi:uncharacterized protein IL334_000106 [Kwoniella shivajii]|uniref:Ribosome biogenesis protein NOP53 n=1 Tax=Kwoniella shivajii TaxID=564305 RepID=A0ABZ1CN81_9TREE|nr:hypothetical protein IL334_000106 [Kwoniella shivajii]